MKAIAIAAGLSVAFVSAAFASPAIGWPEGGTPMTLQWGSIGAGAIASDGGSGAIVAYRVCRQGSSLVMAQRVDQTGKVLWGNGVAVCTGTWVQNSPLIVDDDEGGAIILWTDYRDGEADLYAQRIDAMGSARWNEDGVPVCATSGAPSQLDLMPDEAGGALAIWIENRSGDPEVFVQRVDHSGSALWTADGVSACSAPGGKIYATVTTDGAGGAIATWSDQRTEGEVDLYAQRVDASGAVQWTADGVPLCTAPDMQGMPEMMPDGAGGAIVAWSDYRSGQSDIYAQRMDASGTCLWTTNGIPICTAASTQYYLSIVSDGGPGAVIAWQDYRNGNYDIYAQRLEPSGSCRWAAGGIPLCTAVDRQSVPLAVLDGTRATIVAWTDYRSGTIDIYAQRVDTSGAIEWAPDGVPLCEGPDDQTSPGIVPAAIGGVVAAWLGPSGGTLGICAQRADTAGVLQWAAEGVILCAGAGSQTSSRVVADGDGGAIVVWTDNRSGNADLYAQRVNAWGIGLWGATGNPVCAAPGDQGTHAVIPDGYGGVIVAWDDSRSGETDIYAQRIDASGAALWAAEGIAVCLAPGRQGYADIVSDGAGGAIVAWVDSRAGAWSDIYAQRVDVSGAVRWTADGVPLCRATRIQNLPQIASDGSGGAIVAWMDYRDIEIHTYAQRVNASGTVMWTADGIPVCTAAASQTGAGVAPDGTGGAFFAWVDKRGGSATTNIFAQRVDASGNLLWSAGGVSVCSASDNQYSAVIVSDGAGGAIVSWEDHRAGDYDIYGQRIGGAGAPLWAIDGVPLCAAAGDQTYNATISDGAGGAIVAWTDVRDGEEDIYSQRIDPSGTVLWGTNGVAVCAEASVSDHPSLACNVAGGAIVAWWDKRCSVTIYAGRVFPSGETTGVPDVPLPAISCENYPNPFNPSTAIHVCLPAAADVALDIFDIRGARVATLAREHWRAGNRLVTWDGKNDRGAPCASGVYFARLRAGNATVVRKLVIAR